LAAAGLCQAQFHTNTITTPGGSYAFSVDGSLPVNPTIELQAGVTNILDIQKDPIHPVVVTTDGGADNWFSGADPQGVNDQPMSLITPAIGFPTILYYVCYYHVFSGEIHITGPASPVPPGNTILIVQVGTNVVMTSTGTDTTWD